MRTKFHQADGWTARHALLAGDFVSLCASFNLSYCFLPFYRPHLRAEAFTLEPFSAHAWLLLFMVPLWYVLLEHVGLYSGVRLGWAEVFWRAVRVQGLGLAALSLLIFALKLQTVSRLIVFGFCALYVPVSMATRWLVHAALDAHRSHIYNILRVLVIGSRGRAKEFIQKAKRSEEGYYEVIGCLDPEPQPGQAELEGVPVLGTTEIFRQYVFAHPVDLVVFAMPLDRVPHAKRLIDAAMELGLRVAVVPDFYIPRLGYALDHEAASMDSLFGIPVAVLSNVSRETTYLLLKRVIDIVVSAALLVLLAPLFLLLAILIKLTSSEGPVFYRWRVLGVNKKPFVSCKFRTMVPNADELKSYLAERNEMQGPAFKMRHDPRVTPVGHLLRKYSLDELPQLYSVLKGDMSLVGPRPPSKEEADHFEFWQRRKLSVKPGITCLWQVNGRNQIQSFDEWARLDLEYVQHASLWLDFKILLKTIPAVLGGRGAY